MKIKTPCLRSAVTHCSHWGDWQPRRWHTPTRPALPGGPPTIGPRGTMRGARAPMTDHRLSLANRQTRARRHAELRVGELSMTSEQSPPG
jgi:hypothetical protein